MLAVFQSLQGLVPGVVGTAITLLWKRYGWKQEWLVLIGITSLITSYCAFGLAKNTATMLLGVLFGSFAMVPDPTARALGARLVPPQDQGGMIF